MNRRTNLMTLGIVLAVFFGVAFSCGDDNNQTGGGNGGNGNLPPGEYAFMSITTLRADGKPRVTTEVNGSLTINGNGRYEHDLWMSGAPFGCGPGKYTITGNRLQLTPDPGIGCEGLDYTFLYDEQKNRLSLINRTTPDVTQLLCKVDQGNCFEKK